MKDDGQMDPAKGERCLETGRKVWTWKMADGDVKANVGMGRRIIRGYTKVLSRAKMTMATIKKEEKGR